MSPASRPRARRSGAAAARPRTRLERIVVKRRPSPDGANGDAAANERALALGTAVSPEWRQFVRHWFETGGGSVTDAAHGDWEVALPPALQKRWRRQRVRLVFDPLRATLPRGAWFTAPGSTAGQKVLAAAREEPVIAHRTALARVPGAPEDGIASVCKVRGLTWGAPRLGPVFYERRVAFHAVVTLWGGLPAQESWVLLLGPDRSLVEWARAPELGELRARDGLYQIHDSLEAAECDALAQAARRHFDGLLDEREREWEAQIGRLRDDELQRLSAFFAARVEEEEERSRRRSSGGDVHEMEGGDATSLKLEWERRSAEVRGRWGLRTEVRWWGIEEWSWPVADLEQELKAGAVHVRVTSRVDVARGRPALPACPGCGAPAEMLVRARGAVACVHCAPA